MCISVPKLQQNIIFFENFMEIRYRSIDIVYIRYILCVPMLCLLDKLKFDNFLINISKDILALLLLYT